MAYSEKEAGRLVIEAGHRLMAEGLIARTWGNISARISDTQFLITPSGRAYETLTPADLVKVNISDLSYDGDIKPSSEKGIHADAYRLRPDINFVIHTHQFYATAVGADGDSVVKDGVKVPNASYGMPSTGKLRKAVAAAIGSEHLSKSFLMRRHGALCLGKDLEDAFLEAEELEKLCRDKYILQVGATDEIIKVSLMGKTFRPLIDDLVQIAGTSFKSVKADASDEEIRRALGKNNVCFIKGKGAVCTGDDSEAVQMILKKGCAAALYTGNFKGMGRLDGFIQRFIYLKKYSKQKDRHSTC